MKNSLKLMVSIDFHVRIIDDDLSTGARLSEPDGQSRRVDASKDLAAGDLLPSVTVAVA